MSRSPQKLSSELWTLGAMLELSEASRRRCRHFYDMADNIRNLEAPLTLEVLEREDFYGNVTDEVHAAVTSMLAGENVALLEELEADWSPSIASLLRVEGIGAKRARLVVDTLQVDSLEGLFEASEQDRLTEVKGIGKKKAAELHNAIEEAVAQWREEQKRIVAEEAEVLEAEEIAKAEKAESLPRKTLLSTPAEALLSTLEERVDSLEEAIEEVTETLVETAESVEEPNLETAQGENKRSPRRWLSDVLQAPLASEPGMEIWADAAICRQTGQRFEVKSEVVQFLAEDNVYNSLSQRVMESGFYPRFYERLFRPILTQIVTRRSVSADIELSLQLLHPASDSAVLDVACGTGNYSRALARGLNSERGFVVGLDASDSMLEQASQLRAQEDLWNLFFVRASALQMPFGDDSFDALNCTGALHLFEEPMQGLREFQRVLKTGGRAVIGTFLMSENPVFRRAQEFGREHLGFGWFEYAELLNKVQEAGFRFVDEHIDGLAISMLIEKL